MRGVIIQIIILHIYISKLLQLKNCTVTEHSENKRSLTPFFKKQCTGVNVLSKTSTENHVPKCLSNK